jgi:transposase
MAAPYSVDLRRKILLVLEEGGKSQREVAELFHVSLAFVETLLRRLRAGGEIAPTPHAGGRKSRLDTLARQQLGTWLAAQPDLTLQELAERLQRERGIQVCLPHLCRVLQQLQLGRKKRHSTRANVTRPR